jgi:two-component system OmpR family response regulator
MVTASPNILVVEDDRETRALIAKYLRTNACNVTTANDGREMARGMTDHRVDLLILDVMLPGEDGLSLCRKVRAESQMPIIMLTARGEDVDRILGLEMGADDYLAKPFSPRELIARVKALLRRANPASSSDSAGAYERGRLRMDFGTYQVFVDGVRRELALREFELLRFFVQHPLRVYTREQLLDMVWGRDTFVEPRTVDVHVRRLRQHIERDDANPELILTVRSVGYRFNPEALG